MTAKTKAPDVFQMTHYAATKAFATLRKMATAYVENTDVDDDWTDEDDFITRCRDALVEGGYLVVCAEGCDGGYVLVGQTCTREHRCGNCGEFECECETEPDDDDDGGL